MIGIFIKSSGLAIAWGLISAIISALLNMDFYNVVSIFALAMACTLTVQKEDK